MERWIREKLGQIQELYPPERLEKSRARWQAVWSGEKPEGRYPYLFLPLSFSYYDDHYDAQGGLRAHLDEFIFRGFIDDDFIPAFFPGCRQGAIPGMFGAEEIVVGGAHTNRRTLFEPKDIDALPPPDIAAGASVALYLEMGRYWLEMCEGRIPVHVCDMQGPMDAAAQLYGYDHLFLLAYEDGARYDRLMRLAGEAYCLLWEAQRDALGEHFIGTHLYGWDWVPPSNGATLSADSMAMFSGAFFNEFYLPYLMDIAQRLGPLSVHSCGNFSATVAALGGASCVQAVNASQMTVEQLLEAGWPAEKMIILQEPVERAETVFRLAAEKSLRLNVAFSGLWPRSEGCAGLSNLHPAAWTPRDRARIAEQANKIDGAARAAVV
jgi:hypothetical protein